MEIASVFHSDSIMVIIMHRDNQLNNRTNLYLELDSRAEGYLSTLGFHRQFTSVHISSVEALKLTRSIQILDDIQSIGNIPQKSDHLFPYDTTLYVL